MAGLKYDRYEALKNNDGTLSTMPFIYLPVNPSDKYEEWNDGFNRYDKLAQKYYGNPFYDFLIVYANPSFLSEFDNADGVLVRIPFPLAKAKADYESAMNSFKK